MLFPQSRTLILVTQHFVSGCGRNRMSAGKVAKSGPGMGCMSLSLCAVGTFGNLHLQEQASFVMRGEVCSSICNP